MSAGEPARFGGHLGTCDALFGAPACTCDKGAASGPAKLAEGSRVSVAEPHKDYSDEWLLPGEEIFVLELRDGRARVRCPASGADMWVDVAILVAKEAHR